MQEEHYQESGLLSKDLLKAEMIESICSIVCPMKKIRGFLNSENIDDEEEQGQEVAKENLVVPPRVEPDCDNNSEDGIIVNDIRVDSSGLKLKKNEESKMLNAEELPSSGTSRPPRVAVGGDDEEMLDPKATVMKMLSDAKDQQEKITP